MSLVDLLNKEGCQGCEQRAEIMGAGEWFPDALAIGSLLFLTLVIIYLSK